MAHKIMQKYGFREGQGLGKHEQGLSTALSVEKTSKRGGKIIVGDAADKGKGPLSKQRKCILTTMQAVTGRGGEYGELHMFHNMDYSSSADRSTFISFHCYNKPCVSSVYLPVPGLSVKALSL